MRTIVLALCILVANCFSPVSAKELFCMKVSSKLCQFGECEEIYEGDQQFTIVDTDKKVMALCSQKNDKCDPFPLDAVEEVGAFMLYKSKSAVLKVALIDGASSGFQKNWFIEYRPHMLSVFLAWGMCQE